MGAAPSACSSFWVSFVPSAPKIALLAHPLLWPWSWEVWLLLSLARPWQRQLPSLGCACARGCLVSTYCASSVVSWGQVRHASLHSRRLLKCSTFKLSQVEKRKQQTLHATAIPESVLVSSTENQGRALPFIRSTGLNVICY